MLVTSLQRLFNVNQPYNLLAIVLYSLKWDFAAIVLKPHDNPYHHLKHSQNVQLMLYISQTSLVQTPDGQSNITKYVDKGRFD